MLGRLELPSFDRLTRAEFWPTVERLIESWSQWADVPNDLLQVALQFTTLRRQNARFEPILAKARRLYVALIEPGQRLGCVRTDLPMDVLVRVLEANDAILDGIFVSLHQSVTQASLTRHTRLVFDTFRRLLEVRVPEGRRLARGPRGRHR